MTFSKRGRRKHEYRGFENETGIHGTAVDRQLSELMPELSRSYIQKLLKEGMVLANGKPVKSKLQINGKEELTVTIPDAAEPDIEPENIPLDILYEDEDLLVVNKPKGMVVHPAAGHYSGTLVNARCIICHAHLSGTMGFCCPWNCPSD